MTSPTLFKEYIWLVNTIAKARHITFADINDRWCETEMSGGVEIARATFNRHRKAIADIFGIYIDCDRRSNKYYIANEHELHGNSIQSWMISTLSVSNIISESMSLNDRILLERIPSAGETLQTVIEAMKQNVRLRVSYQSYGSDAPRFFLLDPYCIKLFSQRWYVLANAHRPATAEKPERNFMGVFAFDRIKTMETTQEKFALPKDFDAATFFSECIGVIVGDGTKAERVVLRIYGSEINYLRDLPLHHSQREIGEGDGYVDFEYYLRPTYDFTRAVLTGGHKYKVLSPQWLADDVREQLRMALAMYD